MESMTEIVLYILLQKTFGPEAGGVFGWVLLCTTLPWTKPFWRKCYLWDRPRGDSSWCLAPHAVVLIGLWRALSTAQSLHRRSSCPSQVHPLFLYLPCRNSLHCGVFAGEMLGRDGREVLKCSWALKTAAQNLTAHFKSGFGHLKSPLGQWLILWHCTSCCSCT